MPVRHRADIMIKHAVIDSNEKRKYNCIIHCPTIIASHLNTHTRWAGNDVLRSREKSMSNLWVPSTAGACRRGSDNREGDSWRPSNIGSESSPPL